MNFLYKLFVKNYKNVKEPKVIKSYGLLASILGILLNILLFTIKLLVSLLSGSISIISDAFNNLSDASSSVITLIGFKMSSKPADKEHPFGHQRIEYICAFIISFIIMFIGIELGISSVKKIVSPSPTQFSYYMIIILGFTILIKLWMGIFYKKTSKIINSLSLKASSKDSLNDVITTFVIVIGLFVGKLFDFNIDGYLGVLVSVYILISGILLIKETTNNLIGGTPDKELIDNVINEVSKEKQILGVHDVLYHSYGIGKVYISLHVEMDSTLSLLVAHELIDGVEKRIKKLYGVELVIHVDPILLDNKLLQFVNVKLKEIIKRLNVNLNYHELKIISKKNKTNICFDLEVPYDFDISNQEIYEYINKELRTIDDNFRASICFEKY